MVMVFDVKVAVTPVGNPVELILVAPVVVYVILVMAVLIHLVWLLVPEAEDKVTEFVAVTVNVPVVVTEPHPPVKVMV